MPTSVAPEVLERMRVKERFDCWNRGELDLMLEMYDEDAVVDLSAVFVDDEPVRGHEALVNSWKRMEETWGGGVLLDPLDVLDVGDGRVVLDVRLHGTGTRSGIHVDQRFAFLHKFGPEGKIVHARLLPDVETALAVAERDAQGAAS
jgi:ketosteroid isomerase-like protein